VRGEAARKELTARAGTGTETSSADNGATTTRIAYPDGAVGSFTIGPHGTEFEFRPAK
jgi:hypothetical protein